MGMNNLVEELKKIDLMEREADDRGQGLEPLLQEFVYDMPSLSDEDKINRIHIISDYYNEVYNRSHGNVPRAYTATRRKAMKIFVQHWAKKMDKKYGVTESHNLSKCMDCDNSPTVEVRWAEGMGHAWFCAGCFEAWKKEHKGDIDAEKKITDGKASKNFSDNKNPNIWESEMISDDADSEEESLTPEEDMVSGYTDEMIRFYEERTLRHIGRVQCAAKKLARANLLSPEETQVLLFNIVKHDQSKFKEPEYTPYISLTWRHKLQNENGQFDPMTDKGYQTPGLLDKKDENDATLHHVRNNSHHPEYWLENPNDANIDPNDRNRSLKVVDASLMPDLYIVEMVADWQAMSEELGTNTARQWFNKCQDKRWHFSEHQVELIDKCLRVFEHEVQESLLESAIDFPTDDLPTAIWNKKDKKYSLKPSIKAKVLKYIKSYPKRDLMAISKDIHICGSLATNLYTQYSDFDVHMVIDKDKVNGKEAQEALTKEVLKWSDENPEDIEGYPCHIYMQDNENQEYVGDSLWDLEKEFWGKGPKISRKNFNPYTYYREILGEVEKKAKEADIKIGELSRSVIDYESIRVAYKKIPKDAKASLRDLMKKKLNSIEDDIEALAAYRKEWATKRRNSSQPKSIEQAVTSKSMQKEWEEANAIFKYLTKYEYITTIKALEDILDDDGIVDKDVEDIKKVLSINTDFEKVSPDLTKKEK